MIVLGIESSCDETAVAILDENKVYSHVLHSQIPIHQAYGGVVPELASRDHAKRILPIIHSAIGQAELELSDIDAFAYTAGPGLAGSLLVGATAACTLASLTKKPIFPVHHLEGHIVSAMIDENSDFPAIVILASGGHTMFIIANSLGDYEIVGQTIDDAIGESFDKLAKLMSLGYPGGPIIEEIAKNGDDTRWKLPRPMLKSGDANMSFSGLKTAVLKVWQDCDDKNDQAKSDLAACFQKAVLDVLLAKTEQIFLNYNIKNVLLVGGVAANSYLRTNLERKISSLNKKLICPRKDLCTDNGIMIAKAGLNKAVLNKGSKITQEIIIKPRWNLSDYLHEFW